MSKRLILIVMAGALLCLPLASAWADLFRVPTDVAYYDPAKAYNGVTVFSQSSNAALLMIDMDGKLVRKWAMSNATWSGRLEENGNVSACTTPSNPGGGASWSGGGATGGLEEQDWNRNVVWKAPVWDADSKSHHDYIRIFNKQLQQYTYLVVMWCKTTPAELTAAGVQTSKVPGSNIGVDGVYEVLPNYVTKNTSTLVWKWRFSDHLCQSMYPAKNHYYTDVFQAPQKFDANTTNPQRSAPVTDWQHINSIGFNDELGYIVLNSRELNEVYVIDHDNTYVSGTGTNYTDNFTAAAGDAGDFVYRFGAAQNYHAPNFTIEGTSYSNLPGFNSNGSVQIWGAHGVDFVRRKPYADYTGPDVPGAGNMVIYDNHSTNNGVFSGYSQCLEFNPFVNDGGTNWFSTGPSYTFMHNAPYIYANVVGGAANGNGPTHLSRQVVWRYMGRGSNFFAGHISGAQRLPNGNTLICAAETSHMLEVTRGDPSANEAVDGTSPALAWEYNYPTVSGTNVNINSGGGSATFRCYRYDLNHPALRNHLQMNADFSISYTDGTTPVNGTAPYNSRPFYGVNLISSSYTSPVVPCRSIPCNY